MLQGFIPIESTVDELEHTADSTHALFIGMAAVKGLAFLNWPVSIGSTISGPDVAALNGLRRIVEFIRGSAERLRPEGRQNNHI